jgi:hypothetical protein
MPARARSVIVLAACCVALTGCGAIQENREPWCRPVPATELMARSVPSATLVPCVTELPAGWTFDGFTADDAGSTFILAGPESDAATAVVTFADGCPNAIGRSVRSDEDGTELLQEISGRTPYAARWTYRFDGGCAHVDVDLPADADVDRTTRELVRALSFVPGGALL